MTHLLSRKEFLKLEAEAWPANEVLKWGLERFGERLALATAFGAEGMVLIDMASRLRPSFRVFTIDTDFLFPETYALMDEAAERYSLQLERARPALTPAEQAREFGEALWTRDPDRCCELRKIAPLKAKLDDLDAWVTGLRREQSPTRRHVRKVDWDEQYGLVKLNPLADWTYPQVWAYLRDHGVPYNPLHDRNYTSIGCTHCTRPVRPGEHFRAGRWPGFLKTECGLHTQTS